jgi:hypothetical protein
MLCDRSSRASAALLKGALCLEQLYEPAERSPSCGAYVTPRSTTVPFYGLPERSASSPFGWVEPLVLALADHVLSRKNYSL